jgi:hypothetical protein
VIYLYFITDVDDVFPNNDFFLDVDDLFDDMGDITTTVTLLLLLLCTHISYV